MSVQTTMRLSVSTVFFSRCIQMIAKRFERDDIVEASGNAILYQGRIQLSYNFV